MAVVYIPTPLRRLTKGQAKVQSRGGTLVEVIKNLEDQYPGLWEKVFDAQGEIKPFVNIFVNDKEVRALKGKETPLQDGDEVFIIPAMAGGRRMIRIWDDPLCGS